MDSVPSKVQPPHAGSDAGSLIRHWRTIRRLSQLELSLDADASSRHLSYVETGRSQPSREMVLRLAETLAIPLRERNALLAAAGFAPRYFETDLEAPEMASVRGAIDLILRHQEPYPAFVLDRHWEIRMANQAASRCTRFFLNADSAETNMLRLALHPKGLRPMIVNWEEAAGDLMHHLHSQIAAAPSDQKLKALLAEVLTYPGIPIRWRTHDIGSPTTPLLTTILRKGETEIRFFSTFTTFDTPNDVALEELRIECSFPADESTARTCRRLFGS